MQFAKVVWLYVVVMACLCLTSCTAAEKATRDNGQLSRKERVAREVGARAEKLRVLMPAQTQILMRLSAAEFEGDVKQIFSEQLASPKPANSMFPRLESLDRQRAVWVAAATTGSGEYVERAWLNAPVTRAEELPLGLHIRLLLPTDEPDRLRGQVTALCESTGRCPRWVQMSERGGYLSVDVLTGSEEAPGAALSKALTSKPEEGEGAQLLEHMTPALHRFLAGDEPVAVYWAGQGLLDALLVHRAAEVRSAIEDAPEKLVSVFLLKGQVIPFGRLLSDPRAAEFADVALLADVVAPEDSSSVKGSSKQRIQIDLVRTYTRRGKKVWARPDGGAAGPVAAIDKPVFDFSWRGNGNRLLDNAQAPAWTRGESDAVGEWAGSLDGVDSTLDLAKFVPLLEHPAGLLRAAITIEGANKFRQALAAKLGVATSNAPTLAETLGLRRLSVTAGVAPRGRFIRADRLRVGLLAEWPEPIFGEPEATRGALRDLVRGFLEFVVPEELVGFDADAFEPGVSESTWRGCMGAARRELDATFDALESATPENRKPMVEAAIDTALADAKKCAEMFPNRTEQFRRTQVTWTRWRDELIEKPAKADRE